jgi:dihydroneopterin aldolase/2-amino-4-hydroxy-6-hydroxymethyldihydropteridine diphosphokinase
MALAYIGIGSNLDPERNIALALKLLAVQEPLQQLSAFYRTQAIGRPADPTFINGVAEINTCTPAPELKEKLQRIEQSCGRVHSIHRYAPRTIDLDLLLYGDLVMNSAGLRLPDPDIADRPFLTVPLAELAPDLTVPGTTRTIRSLAARFNRHTMEPLTHFTDTLRKDLAS